MLQELSIKNFAIIDQLEIGFDDGMTVLTGETGAGKSIIIDAVGLLAGGRGSSDVIRHGESKTVLQGQFSMPKSELLLEVLEQYGITPEEDQLILQRELAKSGKNVSRVNGSIVTVSALREIASYLIDIHGQNEHQELMDPTKHLTLLDRFGGSTLETAKADYRVKYEAYRQSKKLLEALQTGEQQNMQRMDLLRFQMNEIEQANLTDQAEEEQLVEERNLLMNFQRIVQGLTVSYQTILDAEGNAMDQLGVAMDALEKIQPLNRTYEGFYTTVSEAFYQLQDTASSIRNELDEMSYDENRLNEIELRLEMMKQLKRKYGTTIEEVLRYYDAISQELDKMVNKESYAEELTKQVQETRDAVLASGKNVSTIRHTVAKKLEEAIHQQLRELYMEKAQFQVSFGKGTNTIRPDGLDEVEFYSATNVGEPFKPLAKVASGGELSRMMLALKTIFTQTYGMTSIIFDEVDTGVSGRVAQAIANKIHAVAKNSQVLCISHLPQVAAMADHHFYIEKEVSDNRTTTSLIPIEGQTRVNEIARMLAGTEITELSIAHAEELLQLADQAK